MDLFDYMRTNTMKSEAPLASRMRPETLEEIVGQQHIIGKDKLLYRAIRADKLGSVIFYGPPGTGKTTIAKVIAHTTKAEFTQINATVAGKKDMEDVVRQAKDNLGMYGKHTILFVDEIHRFNKSQQDYLLPFVEDGTLILIGATTENPYFEVNGAEAPCMSAYTIAFDRIVPERTQTYTIEVTLRNPDCVIRTDFLYYQSAWDLYADGALYAPEEVENVDLAFAVYAEN